MDELLDAIATLVSLVSPEKVQAIAPRVRQTDASNARFTLTSILGTPAASSVVQQIAVAWQKTQVSSDELASMLLAASHVYNKSTSEQSTELVWTGPVTPFVSTRRTEQALLEVIDCAQNNLFVTSFVAYDVSLIVKALNSASCRGVEISILLELSQVHGGAVAHDGITKMQSLVPSASLFAWRDRDPEFSNGRVHAKVAVADQTKCFITSANLTGYAMERNIEAGVLISGGEIPKALSYHLNALITTGVIKRS